MLLLFYTKKKNKNPKTTSRLTQEQHQGLVGWKRALHVHGEHMAVSLYSSQGVGLIHLLSKRLEDALGVCLWLGNVLKSNSTHVEPITLSQDLLFVLGGKISAFHLILPAISLSVLCIPLHSTNEQQPLVKYIAVVTL